MDVEALLKVDVETLVEVDVEELLKVDVEALVEVDVEELLEVDVEALVEVDVAVLDVDVVRGATVVDGGAAVVYGLYMVVVIVGVLVDFNVDVEALVGVDVEVLVEVDVATVVVPELAHTFDDIEPEEPRNIPFFLAREWTQDVPHSV